MIPFDTSTGILMAVLGSLAVSGALAVVRQLHLPIKGIGWCGWGVTLIAMGALVVGFRPLIPPTLSVLVGLPLMVVGLATIWAGIRRFNGRSSNWRFLVLPPAVMLAAAAWFLLVDPSIHARGAIASAINGMLAGLIAFELLRPSDGPIGIARRFTGLVFCAHTAVMVWRSWALATLDPITPYLMPTPIYAFMSIWGLFFVILAGMGFVMMTSER